MQRIKDLNQELFSELTEPLVQPLLNESDIPEASLAGRKPADVGKATLLFRRPFKLDRESTARKTTVCLPNDNNKLLFYAPIQILRSSP